jgi:hypothetical protein
VIVSVNATVTSLFDAPPTVAEPACDVDQFAHAAATVDPDRLTGDPAAVENVATSVAGSPAVTSHRRNPGRDATDEVISAPSRWG